MLLSRHTSSYAWYAPQHYTAPPARRAPFEAPQDKARNASSATATALRELRLELSQLDSIITRLGDSLAHSVAAKEQESELGRPLVSVERNLDALREASDSRFSSLSGSLASLEDDNAALSECCSEIRERSTPPSVSESGTRGWSAESSRQPTPERRMYAASRSSYDRTYSMPSTRDEVLRAASRIKARAVDEHSSRSRRDSPEHRGRPRTTLSLVSQRAIEDINGRLSRRRSVSPTRGANSHSRSRSRHSADRIERVRKELDADILSPAVISRPAPTEPIKTPHGWFIKPQWAVPIELQSVPLPEGQAFAIVVEALQALREASTDKSSKSFLIDSSELVKRLKQRSPNIFAQHSCASWREFATLVQRFVAFHLVFPPLQRELKKCKSEWVLIEDMDAPYYAREVEPPDFDAQMASLCERVGIPPTTWILRSITGPLRCTPEPPERPVQEEHDESTSFPPLREPLSQEWDEKMSRPAYWYELVDILMALHKPDSAELDTALVQAQLCARMGHEKYYEALDACGGLLHFLGVAARSVRIAKAPKQGFITLLDASRPFLSQMENSDYFQRVRLRKRALRRCG